MYDIARLGKQAWDSLAAHFEENSLSKMIEYRRKLYSTKMNSSKTMEAHVNELRTLADRLEALGDTVAEKDLCMILMSSLSEDYDNLLTALENLNVKDEPLKWTYLRDRVISEFERKKAAAAVPGRKKIPNANDSALFTDNYKKKDFNKDGEGKNTSPANNNSFSKKFAMKCHHCGQKGHLRRDCKKLKAEKEASGKLVRRKLFPMITQL